MSERSTVKYCLNYYYKYCKICLQNMKDGDFGLILESKVCKNLCFYWLKEDYKKSEPYIGNK